jgi:integrase
MGSTKTHSTRFSTDTLSSIKRGGPGKQLVVIKRPFGEACKVAGLIGLRFHDLRHTATTRLADAGINIIVIAEILGHSDIRTTKRYSHAMDETMRGGRKTGRNGRGAANVGQKSVKRKTAS